MRSSGRKPKSSYTRGRWISSKRKRRYEGRVCSYHSRERRIVGSFSRVCACAGGSGGSSYDGIDYRNRNSYAGTLSNADLMQGGSSPEQTSVEGRASDTNSGTHSKRSQARKCAVHSAAERTPSLLFAGKTHCSARSTVKVRHAPTTFWHNRCRRGPSTQSSEQSSPLSRSYDVSRYLDSRNAPHCLGLDIQAWFAEPLPYDDVSVRQLSAHGDRDDTCEAGGRTSP